MDDILEAAKSRRIKTIDKPKAAYLSPALHAWLKTYCDKQGVYVLDVLNSLVAKYKDQVERTKKPKV